MLDRKWQSHVTGRGPVLPYYFSRTFSPYFFPRTFSPVLIFPYYYFSYFFPVFFSLYYFPVLFQKSRRLKSNVLKYQWVVFSSTRRYNTVHVPCRIFIQTSPVWLPLDGWGARMRDLKGPKINLFNPKEDWNVL